MASISRPLTGPHLIFRASTQAEELRGDEAYARSGRAGRTLAKQGPLRLVLVVLREGVEVGTHHAEAPMTLQPLEGRIRYRVGEDVFELGAGEILFFGPGHARDIRALEDVALLMTVTRNGSEETE